MIEAAVLGRVGVDLYPNQLRTPLREIRTYTRFVGGFAGNVSTGLARLGIRAAQAVYEKDFGKMVAVRGTDVVTVDIEKAVGVLRTVPLDLYETAKTLFKSDGYWTLDELDRLAPTTVCEGLVNPAPPKEA